MGKVKADDQFVRFLHDKGSTTYFFKKISQDYVLNVIDSYCGDDYCKRSVAIYLDQKLVMLATSMADMQSPIFFEILSTTGEIPIGVRLFDRTSGITRGDFIIDKVNISNLQDQSLLKFLTENSYNLEDEIYQRSSRFIKDNQSMLLVEYIFPELSDIIQVNCGECC